MKRTVWPRPTGALLACVLCAGCEDFSSQAAVDVTIERAGIWPAVMMVTDTARVVVRVTQPSGAILEGVLVQWSSSRPEILTVAETSPPDSVSLGGGSYRRADRRDTLAAQLSATLTARRSGTATLSATVAHEGVEHARASVTVAVNPWAVEAAGDWPDGLDVTDTTVLELDVTNADTNNVDELRVDWSSGDESVLKVRKVVPPLDATPRERLDARRRAIVTAHRRGVAALTVTVDRPGFESAEYRDSVVVRPYEVGLTGPWPDTLTVTETDTIELDIPPIDTALANELRVVWVSSDEAVLKVVPALPPDTANRAQTLAAKRLGVVTAYRRGAARVIATAGREGFEQATFSDSIAIMPVVLEPAATWVDTTFVGDIDTLEIAVRDWHGGPLLGRSLRWQSSDPERLVVTRIDSVRAALTVHARGTAEVSVLLDQTGFETPPHVHVIRLMEQWQSVSAGEGTTCGITIMSQAYCWGTGLSGALGNGTTLNSLIPSRVISIGGLAFDSVGVGLRTGCALVYTVYCWGRGALGVLGNGDARESDQLSPVQVSGGQAFTSVSPGGTRSGGVVCAIDDRSLAWCWGDNDRWQLGVDVNDLSEPPLEACGETQTIPCSRVPRRVGIGGAAPDAYTAIDVGGSHTCGLGHQPEGPTAFCWGMHAQALGNRSVDATRTPIVVESLPPVRSISAGQVHTCAITLAGDAYCWGSSFGSGTLGDGTLADREVPVLVQGGRKFIAIGAGEVHTCAITDRGTAYCWGRGREGQLGNGLTVDRTVPDSVVIDKKFKAISAGSFHTCAVASGVTVAGTTKKSLKGAIYCWGNGTGGRLGDGAGVARLSPVRVAEPP